MNIIELAREIEERYRRYLRTTFYFRDPNFRRAFEEALNSGHLSKGPYLQATPAFVKAASPRTLFSDLLGSLPPEEFLTAVHGDRPLYQHQEQAIRRACAQGRNVVVATGTGSGKTEAFLYPILLHLYKEFQAGTLDAGVRALILYPMNALANDQRERLAGLPSPSSPPGIMWTLQELRSPFRFQFGQYTGETPEDARDKWRHAGDLLAARLPGELVLRSEMRQTPPHILLTNYSMLEYLLLRPNDTPLFDNGQARSWRFLVLDEVHQYRGSKGNEMAMLLRRLKQRLREGGRKEPFTCIATSATLSGGAADRAEVAQFASDLFDERFDEDDVILGETSPIPEPGANRLAPESYRDLLALLSLSTKASPVLNQAAAALDIQAPTEAEAVDAVGHLLQADRRVWKLRTEVTARPQEAHEVADSLFDDLPEQHRLEALENLSELLLQARDPSSGTPLLSIRYHLFLRSLEGAFISYWPEQHVYLDRKGADANCAVFEVALCRECGQHYIIAQKDFVGGKVREPVRDAGLDEYGVTFLRPMDGGESEGDDLENEETPARNRYRLCVRCGEMGKSTSSCDHAELIDVVRERSKDEDAPDQIVACGSCGYSGAGRDPVREVIYGADGPHVVIATALHQYLPEGRKKVLAFADGRQEAAYFAWYLESSYAEIVGRRLILNVARELSPQTRQGLSLSELAKELDRRLDDQGLVPPSMGDLDRRRAAWARLYKEFLTDEPRNSLEGTGLVAWSINWPKAFQPPRLLTEPPWSLTPNEARALVFVLLDSARTTRAVEIRTEQGITLNWQDLELQGAQRCITGVETGKLNRNEQRWTGVRGRRVDFLKRYLRTRGVDERECIPLAVGALRAIWEAFRQADSAPGMAQAPLLIPIRDARRLNPNWWRLRLVGDDQGAYRCQVCGRIQTISMGGICSRYTCPGTLEPLPADGAQRDHYRLLYEEVSSPPLRVEEHTAQLAHEKAREFQRDFREGRINVLSCSTTFELGVDLGDLDTTFLRNVPPEAFNYAQRVGRAGRRSGTPGFAITYCRRNPHDLYHYADPWPMLAGQVRPPVITLQNSRIVSRHVAAVALSAFFRSSPGRFGSVGEFLVDMATPSGTADFLKFLKDRRIELEKTLRCIVPFDIQREIGLEDDGWVNEIAGPNSRFALAEAEMASDFQILSNLRERAHQAGEDRSAAWAGSRMRTLKGEDALSFLSRKAIIPKYGFPVDVVELDTQRWDAASDASNVTLQRDLTLAIAEFAPTSKLIANKKVWTSYGVKRVAERELPKWWYARCETHARFERVPFQADRPFFNRCCDRMVIHQYVEPQFGFITSRDKPAEPKGRPAREFTTRPYFGGFKSNEGSQLDFGPATINVVSPGYMVVLCEGRRGEGFFLCNRCGAGFRSITRDIQAQHLSPYGEPCSGVLRPAVSLGHELVTDVLKIDFTVIPDGSIEPRWLAVSVAHALVEGAAELMDIPSNDLNTTVAGLEDRPALPSVILYDNVPGGAGLVARLQTIESFRSCLVAARRRVSGTCGCDADTSCYGCLRNYRNQFAHPYLQRGAAYDYLATVLSAW